MGWQRSTTVELGGVEAVVDVVVDDRVGATVMIRVDGGSVVADLADRGTERALSRFRDALDDACAVAVQRGHERVMERERAARVADAAVVAPTSGAV